MRKRVTSHRPAIVWTFAMVVGPFAGHLAGLQPPHAIAYITGLVSPILAAAWRVTR